MAKSAFFTSEYKPVAQASEFPRRLRTLQRVFSIETGMSFGRWRSNAGVPTGSLLRTYLRKPFVTFRGQHSMLPKSRKIVTKLHCCQRVNNLQQCSSSSLSLRCGVVLLNFPAESGAVQLGERTAAGWLFENQGVFGSGNQMGGDPFGNRTYSQIGVGS